VDLDTGEKADELREEPGDEGVAALPQRVGEAVPPDGVEAGVQ
jgi:hypothetical protein